MADRSGSAAAAIVTRLRHGIITRAEAAAELLTLGIGIDRTRAALADYDLSRAPQTATRVLAAAEVLATALDALHGMPNRTNRQAVGNAEDELITAVRDYRAARDSTDTPATARDEWLAAFPTPAALEAAVNAFRARKADVTPPPTIG